MKLLWLLPLFLSLLTPLTSPLLQKSKDSLCPNCPARISLGSTRKIPVYVPIPVFTVYQIPIIHHYPLNQVVRQMTPIPIEFPIEHRINRPYPIPIPVEQKILIPQPVPYGVKVPIPVPRCIGCERNESNSTGGDNRQRSIDLEIHNLVEQSLKNDFDKVTLGMRNGSEWKTFDSQDLAEMLDKPGNESFSVTRFLNRSETNSNMNNRGNKGKKGLF